jgi:hypothetical protein
MHVPLPNESPSDPEAEWDLWVANLPKTTRRILTDPASDRELVYRGLFSARRIGFGAILLELFAVEEETLRGHAA